MKDFGITEAQCAAFERDGVVVVDRIIIALDDTSAEGGTVEPVGVKADGNAFHGGWTWHGSDINRRDVARGSVVAHCMSRETRFHPTRVGYIYSPYKRLGDDTMDESFFPLTWRDDGNRSPFIDPFVARCITWGEAVPM